MTPNPLIIHPKDIQRVIGVGYRSAVRLHKRIRAHFGKAQHQFLTVEEFCAFTGLKVEHVESRL